MLDHTGLLLQANRAFCRMLDQPVENVVGKLFFEFIAPQQRPIFTRVYRVIFYQPGDQDLELLLLRGGQTFPVRVTSALLSGEPIQVEGGPPSPLLLIITDLTGQGLAEEIQRVTDLRFRQLTETITEVFWLRDRSSGRLLYVSPAYKQVFGRPVEELLENPDSFLERVHPEDRPRVREVRQRLAEQGTDISMEYRIIDAEGQVRWIWARTYPVTAANGDIIRYAGIAADITRLKRTEESLRESEQRYRNLFTTMLEGFALHEIITDDDGTPLDYRFLEINPAFEHLTGLRAADLLGHTVRDALPSIEEVWIERYGRVALTGEPDTLEEYLADLGRWFRVHAYAPRPGQFATIVIDITERKHTEDALQQSAEQNRLLLRELQHRVKNSLALIVGIINLEADRVTDPATVAMLGELEERIQTISELYKELHSTGGTQRVSLNAYLERIVASVASAYMTSYQLGPDAPLEAVPAAATARPVIQLNTQPVEIKASLATPLGLILNELLTNAIKYAFPQGGGQIRVSLRQVGAAQGSQAGIKLVLEVEDDGVGVAEDFLPGQFGGLGMQLVEMLTRSLQGQLTIHPRSPTRFQIEVPLPA